MFCCRSLSYKSVESDFTSAVSAFISYLNSAFEFTRPEIEQLQKTISAVNTITACQFEDLKTYYKGSTETIQATLNKLKQYISCVREDIKVNHE